MLTISRDNLIRKPPYVLRAQQGHEINPCLHDLIFRLSKTCPWTQELTQKVTCILQGMARPSLHESSRALRGIFLLFDGLSPSAVSHFESSIMQDPVLL